MKVITRNNIEFEEDEFVSVNNFTASGNLVKDYGEIEVTEEEIKFPEE
jgi:hypothetical protein